MIKLLIISSLRNKELGEFLEQRGTFEICGCYDSLNNNLADIQNSILKVDKTLYLYQLDEDGRSNVNIRTDMQILQNMLTHNSFFVPGEIIFITQKTQQCQQAGRYFMSVMNSCKYENYSIHSMDEAISFSTVYYTLMGISENANFRNSFKTLWRTERNSDSSFAYESQDDSDLLLEPFLFDSIKEYEDQKKLIAKTTSVVEFKDAAVQEVEQFRNPKLHKVEVRTRVAESNINIITGKAKSGLSMWTSALAVSAAYAGEKVLILDYTSNTDISDILTHNDVKHESVTMKDVLRGNSGESICVCGVRNDRENKVKINFLQHFFSRGSEFSLILIALDNSMLRTVYALLKGQLNKILLTVVPRHNDVLELQEYVSLFSENDEIMVLMNECIKLQNEEYLSQDVVKRLLTFFNPKVVKSCFFNSLNLKDTLFNKILRLEETDAG